MFDVRFECVRDDFGRVSNITYCFYFCNIKQWRIRISQRGLRQTYYLPTASESNVFADVCLSTIGLMDTRSLLGLVTARSVGILLECILVWQMFGRELHKNERNCTERGCVSQTPL